MHPERVDITRVSAVVVAVVVAIVVGAFGSLLLGHLFPIVEVIVLPSGGCPRARATVIRIITPPIVFRSGDTSW
jgi:hypothetical protein